jgi:pyocin large subunit-like protein
MKRRSIWGAAALAALALGTVAGCDQKLAVQPARDHQASDEAPATALAGLGGESERAAGSERTYAEARPREPARADRADDAPVRRIKGHPMWSDNRRHSAGENAQYQFEHHGAELGARDLDDFVSKAHAVLNEGGAGVLSHTRANGDRLIYDPKSRLFGVVRSDGAPRTVFRPDEGRAYWDAEVARDQGGGSTRRRTDRSARRDGDDQG